MSTNKPPSSTSRGPSLRQDNVGKRFLCVSGAQKIKLNRYNEWPWRAGVIRCSSHLDSSDKELQFLVEFDDQPWESREWVNVYSDSYHIFLVESLLSVGSRPSTARGSLHPLIVFSPLVDNIGFFKSKHHSRPVEFLQDSLLDFQDTSKLKAIRDWDPSIPGLDTSSANERAVRAWAELQDGQHLLINTPSVLIGLRIKVYRAEGTTQWYTAVTTGYNDDTGEFTLIDDTVLEEHYEDPRLTQLKLLGDGVVESILKGENIGITPRRSRSAVGSLRACHHYSGVSLPRRVPKRPPAAKAISEKVVVKRGHRKRRLAAKKEEAEASPKKAKPSNQVCEKPPPSQSSKRSVSCSSSLLVPLEKSSSHASRLSRSGCPPKRKAVAIVRPQPQILLQKQVTKDASASSSSRSGGIHKEEEDLKARYSLYDFHSDESDDEKTSSSKPPEASNHFSNPFHSNNKRPLKIVKGNKRQRILKTRSKNTTQPLSAAASSFLKNSVEEDEQQTERSDKKKPPSSGLKKEATTHPSSVSNKQDEEVKKEGGQCAKESANNDTPVNRPEEKVAEEQHHLSNGCLSNTQPSAPQESTENSSNSNVSLIPPPPKQISMGDHPSAERSPSGAGDRRHLPPAGNTLSAAAANLTALTAHYQAAALQQAAAAHGSGLSPHLLAQYHQSLAAAGIPPDMLLKQGPFGGFNAAAAGNPGGGSHLLGRNEFFARERELAADRERIFRERAEAEQRERERHDKERKEKERHERERREREERERRERRNAESDFLKKQQAVEAVDQHFQLSMELAKKKMADAGQHWSQLPGITKDDRRKFEDSRHDAAAAAFRQQQQYINAMAANIGNSRLPVPEPKQQQQLLGGKDVVFKPYENSGSRYNSVSPGHSTPSPHLSAASPPSTPFFPASSPPRVPPPPAHASLTPRPTLHDEMPLDLGAAPKRSSDPLEMPPKKAGRFDAPLYKVLEPSVLPPEPAPSVISTVINKAVMPENLSTHSEEQLVNAAPPTSRSVSSNQSNQDTNSDEDFGYVHKLKKAWIKAYSEPNTAPPTPSHPPIKSSFSNPPTPNPRATPSPALSTHSSSKTTSQQLNGHGSPLKKESSSSDSEANTSSGMEVLKRRGKKGSVGGKRGKGAKANGKKAGTSSKQQRDSDSNSESDKESQDDSNKPKKRGRKPGLRKEPDRKNPFQKPSMAQLKKTGESFLQDASCFEVAPKLAKCRECRWTQSQRNKKMPNIFCRFYAFRRLKFTKNGQLAVSGFCNPMRDASESDVAVWSPEGSKSKVDREQALKVLRHLRHDFTTIMEQERAAQAAHMASDDTVAWKRVVQGVREMCDVCDATLFNFHWACSRCGFVVCVDCYLARKEDVTRSWGENDKERDRYSWLLCTNRQGHELEKLVLTQIVAGDALGKVESLLGTICSSSHLNGSLNGHKVEKEEESSLQHFVPKKSLPHLNQWKTEEIKREEEDSLTTTHYSWLCEGRVLCLDNDSTSDCLDMFRLCWGSGNPVVIRHPEKSVSSSWEPQKLIECFGDVKAELVDSLTDVSQGHFPVKKFLGGFLDPEKVLRDEDGTELHLKAKDWPPQGEEFAEAFPSRCSEFLGSLPLPAFTDRSSRLNLASSLPDVFVRPDLGPRAWFVHGSPDSPEKGTINAHVDIADSLNVVVFSESTEAVALWHVYHPRDADKIRDLLNKETGVKDLSFDHLHEETKYLDSNLRAKLKSEYGVSACTLLQRPGEAVLIPAGSPKQVKHLKCCIALSSDFVSAESLSHSFNMLTSMRHLSESQTMGEDKLQVKNLIFHSVKDALRALSEEKS